MLNMAQDDIASEKDNGILITECRFALWKQVPEGSVKLKPVTDSVEKVSPLLKLLIY